MKEFKRLLSKPYVLINRKDGYQIIKNKYITDCSKCKITIYKGTYVLWKKDCGVICTTNCC